MALLGSTSPTPAIHESQPEMEVAVVDISTNASKNKDLESGSATITRATTMTSSRTMSVPTDAYHALLILMTDDPDLWESLPKSERRAFFAFAIVAGIIQYGCIICLLIDICITDVAEWSIFTNEKSQLDTVKPEAIQITIVVKLFAIFMLSCYVLRDFISCWRVPILCDHLKEFYQWKFFVYYVMYFNYGLLFLSSLLAFISIMQSANGFDAFSNAVSVMFILEVDDWMYQICSLHSKLNDDMFEVEYNPNIFIQEVIDENKQMEKITAQKLFEMFVAMTFLFAAFGSLLGGFIFGHQAAYMRAMIFFLLFLITAIIAMCNRRKSKKNK